MSDDCHRVTNLSPTPVGDRKTMAGSGDRPSVTTVTNLSALKTSEDLNSRGVENAEGLVTWGLVTAEKPANRCGGLANSVTNPPSQKVGDKPRTCRNGPRSGHVSRSGVVHGEVFKNGLCERCYLAKLAYTERQTDRPTTEATWFWRGRWRAETPLGSEYPVPVPAQVRRAS